MSRYLILTGKFTNIEESKVEDARQYLDGLEIVRDPDAAWMKKNAAQIEIIAGGVGTKHAEAMTGLKWVQLSGAGAESALRALGARDVVITNASGVHGIPIAEHILGMMLSFARGFHRSFPKQVEGVWDRSMKSDVFELDGKTVLVIGAGAIGRAFAVRGKALGMRVRGIKRSPLRDENGSGFESIRGPEELEEELEIADMVVLILPHTPATDRCFGKHELELMKRSAFFFNVGRGKTVDEDALIDALQNGTIAGAGLDVFAEEPLPENSPLWKMENVILTAHYSGLTPEYDERLWGIFIKNLERYKRGEKLINRVDPELGY